MDKHIDESIPYLGQVWALSSRSFTEAAGELLKVFRMEGVCIIMWTISEAMSDFFGMDGQMEIQVDVTAFKISAALLALEFSFSTLLNFLCLQLLK